MVKGPNLKSNELPRLNLPEILLAQSLTCGAALLTRRGTRARAHEPLTCGTGLSASAKNRKKAARRARLRGLELTRSRARILARASWATVCFVSYTRTHLI